ncbi:MAG: T9SS type A sorting domain-containing protein [Saprospiraceae bacterium]|nr:T9SS type A sorting domain-containing protein [Saprospiraceae bacterium]
MKNFLIIFLLFVHSVTGMGQKHDQIWIGGIISKYQFPNDCPQCTRVMTFADTGIHYQYVKNYIEMRETSTVTMSDKDGNLQFYTNGNTIASHDHSVMENGLRLNEGSFFSNYNVFGDSVGDWGYDYFAYMVLPDPEQDQYYYMLHTYILSAHLTDSVDNGFRFYSDRLLITKIDMSANGGKGKVLYKNKPLYKAITGARLNVVQHGNGRDWWVLMTSPDVSVYHVLQIYKDSLIQAITQPVPSIALKPFDFNDSIAFTGNVPYLSPNGKIIIDREGRKGFCRLFDFDRCDGTILLRDTLDFGVAIFNSLDTGSHKDDFLKEGLREFCFSPNNRYLYAGSVAGYWQYDLEAQDILASGVQLSGPSIVMDDITQEPILWQVFIPAMVHGPDGKLYALWRAIHHVVHDPNEKGLASDFCLAFENPPSCLQVPHHLFSPWSPNYRLGAEVGSPCDTLSTTIPETSSAFNIRIYPNPGSGPVYLDITLPEYSNQDVHIEVVNSLGQVVHRHRFPDYAYIHILESGLLSTGMYYVRLLYHGRQVATERMMMME